MSKCQVFFKFFFKFLYYDPKCHASLTALVCQSGEQVLVLGNFRVLADDRPNRFRLISSNESIVRIPPKRLEIILVFKMASLATRVSIN